MIRALGFSLLLMSLSASGEAPKEHVLFEHAAFALPLQQGERSQKGGADEGMVKVKSGPADQILYWNKATKTLRERADHERNLMLRAAEEEGVKARVSDYARKDTPGKGSLSWTARIGDTTFQAVVVDCGTHHVLLTTFGSDSSQVASRHKASSGGLKCALDAAR